MPNDGSLCPGCGAELQSERPGEPGYLPQKLREREGAVCQRCFRLHHYKEYHKPVVSDTGLRRALEEEWRQADAALVVIDPLTVDMLPRLLRQAEDAGVTVTAAFNKADLLYPARRAAELEAWLAARHGGLEVIACSASRGFRTGVLRERLLRSGAKRIVALGLPNAGKSTLLNSLAERERHTVSALPGTTVGALATSLGGGVTLVDFPGLASGTPLFPLLCPDCLAALSPKKRLSVTSLVLKPGKGIMLGGAVWVRYDAPAGSVSGEVEVAVPDTIAVHGTTAGREEELLHRHGAELFGVPCGSCVPSILERMGRWKDLVLERDRELSFPYWGWIRPLGAEPLKDITVLCPGDTPPSVRMAMSGESGAWGP
ncbi:MAG: 50S ribosome-binding GTPase [Synergistales bacterium]|nr:50S ribosome-binding GTPase [Synergistales bacterium]